MYSGTYIDRVDRNLDVSWRGGIVPVHDQQPLNLKGKEKKCGKGHLP